MRRWWLVLGLVGPLVACPRPDGAPTGAAPPGQGGPVNVRGTPAAGTAGGGGGEASTAPGVPVAAPAPGRRAYRSAWEDVPAGQAPPELVDVRADGHVRSWLYDGGWRIAHRDGQAILEVPFALTEPYEPLSFRRWTGNTFGPPGTLPRRYRVEADARSLGGSKRFGGYGEVAIQAFYLGPENYVEVLQTDRALLLWQAKDAPPMQGKGWRQLARLERPRRVGEWLRFGAEVDRDAKEILGLLDGKVVLRAEAPLLGTPGGGGLTIRATGNKEEWRRLEIVEIR